MPTGATPANALNPLGINPGGVMIPATNTGSNTDELANARAYLAQTQGTYAAQVDQLGGLNNPSNPANEAQARDIWNAQTSANNVLLAHSPTYNPNTGI